MTDRELLELAAKAAGYPPEWHGSIKIETANGTRKWSPLEDDGDALRMAVKLGLSIAPYPIFGINQQDKHSVLVKRHTKGDLLRAPNNTESIERYGDDPYAATRRAITRAAAEIGKAMS